MACPHQALPFIELLPFILGTQQVVTKCGDPCIATAANIADTSILYATNNALAVAQEEHMGTSLRVSKCIQGLQEIEHLNMVSAAAHIPLLALYDEKRPQLEERSALNGKQWMRIDETVVQLHLRSLK